MNDYDPVLQKLEQDSRDQRDRIVEYVDNLDPDVGNWLRQKFHEIDTGIDGARNCWHSISPAQRRTLQVAALRGRLSINGKEYRPVFWSGRPQPIRIRTVRALCAHELLAWDGGAFDPEAAVVITERGLFVLRHGSGAVLP